MDRSTRRRILRVCGVSVAGGLAGCSGVLGGDDEEDDIKDTDNDGVIDSEDYAPRDPDVQRKEQVEEVGSGGTSTEEPTETPTENNPGLVVVDEFETDFSQWNQLRVDRTSVSLTNTQSYHGEKSLMFEFEGDGINQNVDLYAPNTSVTEGERISIWFKSDSFGQGLRLSLGGETNFYGAAYRGWKNEFGLIRATSSGRSDLSSDYVNLSTGGWIRISVTLRDNIHAEIQNENQSLTQLEAPFQGSFDDPSIRFKTYASMSPEDTVYADYITKRTL